MSTLTVQKSQSSLCDGVSHHFETMLKELISQKQMLSNIEGKLLEVINIHFWHFTFPFHIFHFYLVLANC